MLESKYISDRLTVYLVGEIDHCTAQHIRQDIEVLLNQKKAKHLTLDFTDVSFMDSSGVGMIIGRYKTVTAHGGSMSASGLHAPIDRLFHLAGLHRILTIEKTEERGRNDHE